VLMFEQLNETEARTLRAYVRVFLRSQRNAREYTTGRLDSWSPFPYHECSSEVEDAEPERMGKNL
jgi:hypothetical protein